MTLPGPTATMTSPSKRAQHQQTRTRARHTATGTSVAQLPEPVPELEHTNRSQRDHYEPGQHSHELVTTRRPPASCGALSATKVLLTMVGLAGFEPTTSCP